MRTVLKLAFVAAILASASPSFGQLYIGVGVRVGPPAPKREVVGRPPHRGMAWVAGHYDWRPKPHRYEWVRGYWARPPHPNDTWVEGRWEKRHGEWVYTEGKWNEEHHQDEPRHRERP
ncbi:MAG: hypothetical protein ACLP05_10825 [Candidatus Kryptoniota bacterium]